MYGRFEKQIEGILYNLFEEKRQKIHFGDLMRFHEYPLNYVEPTRTRFVSCDRQI